MAKKKTNPESAELESQDFEKSIEELESIVRRLEQGGGTLESALGDYAKAIGLLKNCHTRLEQAERKIEILSGVDAQGNPVTHAVTDAESTLAEKQESRGDRRSAASKVKARATKKNDSSELF